jgi:hypothetical protein
MRRTLWMLLGLVACGEPFRGEIDVEVRIGSATFRPTVGIAVEDPNNREGMVVFVTDGEIDCPFDILFDAPPAGTSFYSFMPRELGAHSEAYSAVWRIDDEINKNVAFSGTAIVERDSGDRVAGQVSGGTMDSELGLINVSGRFEVRSCF